MLVELLRLPFPRVRQRDENSKVKPGKGIQGAPQPGQTAFRLTELLCDRP